jgi:hypothetical protein
MISIKLVSLICLGISLAGYGAGPNLLSQQRLPPDLLVTLERPGCWRGCADYRVTIAADGKVVFEGKENVRVKGTAQTKISREKVLLLVDEVVKAKFFSLRDQYMGKEDGCRTIGADFNSAITSVVMNGKAKTINHYFGCFRSGKTYPNALIELEEKIDEIANTDQWTE